MNLTAYHELMEWQRQTEALSRVAGRLSWDQETMMPKGAAAQRSEEAGAMQAILHARQTDPRVGEWLAKAEVTGAVSAAQLRHIKRSYRKATKVPVTLAVALAKLTSRSQGVWAQVRADEDFTAFIPVLNEVVQLKREEGAALADGGGVYDALVDAFEPGMTASALDKMFAVMRPRLVALRQMALAQPEVPMINGTFGAEDQMRLSRMLAKRFGYDMNRGRLDKAVHPFSSGSGDDVRITTRTSESDPFNCIYSTIHETGHACYEQGIDTDYALSPLGQGVSMAVHESQSRIYENQLGRSEAFCGWLYQAMKDQFGDFGIDDARSFYACVNRVGRGFIRTEADEPQYNLHVMLRFDLERALVSGDLPVQDLNDAWNTRFKDDFGYAVENPSDGCLQDVHWSVGLFGYFPTYNLGNVYAGCLNEALRKAVPDLDQQLGQGDLTQATAWLRENVQQHGGLYEPKDLITSACRTAPTAEPLLTYLEEKFTALYQQ